LKYSCNIETGSCEVDASSSLSLQECSKSCVVGDKSLPDLMVKSFAPEKMKINETAKLQIVETNKGGSIANTHKFVVSFEFNGQTQTSPAAYFNKLEANSEQEAIGN